MDEKLRKLKREFATQPTMELARRIVNIENMLEMPVVKYHKDNWKLLDKGVTTRFDVYPLPNGTILFRSAVLPGRTSKEQLLFIPGIRLE